MSEQSTTTTSRFVTVLFAGLIVGAILTFFNVSMAALIFKGELKPYLATGISLILSGTVVLVLVTALLSSLPNVVSVPQEVPISILAFLAVDIVHHMRGQAGEQIFATVLGAIIVSTVLTGLFFWLLGRFQLGKLIRYIPYPVIGGFLAGTGWLLLIGAIHVMTDVRPGAELLNPATLIHWAPGLIFGMIVLLMVRRYTHFLLMPGLITASIVIFYLLLALMGQSPAQALQNGLLLGPLPAGRLWEPAALLSLRDTNWTVVFSHHGLSLTAIPLVGALALLLNATALELATGHDADLSRELRTGGISNLLAALVGSPSGFIAVSETTLGLRLGGQGRMFSYTIAAVTAAVLILGAAAIAYIPRVIAGGLLCFLGLSFLVEWLWDARHHLSRLDYALVWAIMIAIGLLGFLEGVGIGIIVAAVLFVLSYSRIDAVRHVFTRADYPSYVARSPEEEDLLLEHGHGIVIAQLHGYLFFGTAHSLITRLHSRLESHGLARVHFVLLDFRLVSGMDSSVAHSFHRLLRHLQQADARMVFTGMAPEMEKVWFMDSRNDALMATVPTFPSLDQGLSWCEEDLLLRADPDSTLTDTSSFVDRLLDALPPMLPGRAEELRQLLETRVERRAHAPNDTIIRQSEQLKGIAYVESGEVIVQTHSAAGPPLVLRRLQQGTIIGEISFYSGDGATADVIAADPCTLSYLSRTAITALEADHPELAVAIHRLLARDLSRKLAYTTRAAGAIKM